MLNPIEPSSATARRWIVEHPDDAARLVWQAFAQGGLRIEQNHVMVGSAGVLPVPEMWREAALRKDNP